MSVFNNKDSVFFVGGTGDKSGHVYAGGCTKEFVDENGGFADFDLSIIMNDNGQPVASTEIGQFTLSGKVIDAQGAFANVAPTGMIAYISDGSSNIATDYYEVQKVSSDRIYIPNISAFGDSFDVTVVVGGAKTKLSDAVSTVSALNHGVHVFSNKNEILHSPISVMGNGSATYNTFFNVIGFNTTLFDMCSGGQYYQSPQDAYLNGISSSKNVVIDGDGGSINLIAPVSQVNTRFQNFHFTNTTNVLIDITSGTNENVVVDNCKFSQGACAVNFGGCDSFYANNCYAHHDITGARFSGQTGYITGSIINGDPENGNHSIYLHGGKIEGCIIIDGYKYAITCIGSGGYLIVKNNTFCNTPEVVVRLANGVNLEFINNICRVPQCCTIIRIETSGGNINRLDNNCYWGTDGNPLTTLFQTEVADGQLPVKSLMDIEADPLFANAENETFRPTNPAIIDGGQLINEVSTYIGAVGPKHIFKSNAKCANYGRLSITRS